MGVLVGRAAVRRPAGVTDAGGAVRQRRGARSSTSTQLAGLLARAERAVVGDDGDAGGVVAAVLQPLETAEEDLDALVRTDVTHDATHASQPIRPSLGSSSTWRSDTLFPMASDIAAERARHPTPFVEIDRAAWAALAPVAKNPLSRDRAGAAAGLGDRSTCRRSATSTFRSADWSTSTRRARAICTAARATSWASARVARPSSSGSQDQWRSASRPSRVSSASSCRGGATPRASS